MELDLKLGVLILHCLQSILECLGFRNDAMNEEG